MRNRGSASDMLGRARGSKGFGRWPLVLLSVTLACPRPAVADVTSGIARWTNVGPWGGSVAALAFTSSTPSMIYAGTWFAGVYRSRNHAGTWQIARRGMPPGATVFSLVVDPYEEQILYAGILDIYGDTFRGVYKSTDGGGTWGAVNDGIDPSAGEFWAMGGTPWGNGVILAGGFDGIYRTTNRGARWEKAVIRDYLDPWVRCFATDPRRPTLVYAGCTQGILKSSDGGKTWTPSDNGMPNGSFEILGIAIDPKVSSTLYAIGPAGVGVWRSTDSGGTWTRVRHGSPAGDYDSVTIDPIDPNTLYVGANGLGVLKTTDAGATWTLLTEGLPQLDTGPLYQDIEVDPQSPSTVYVATSLGLYRSDDAGATWVDANRGLAAFDIEEVALDRTEPRLVYALAGSSHEFIISRSMDQGSTWQKIYPGPSGYGPDRPEAYAAGAGGAQSGVLYIAGRYPKQVVYRSTDAGDNWTRVFARGDSNGYPSAVVSHPASPRRVYLAIGGSADPQEGELRGVFRSDDGGDSWKHLAPLPKGELYPSCIALYPADRRIVFVGGYAGVYGSRNGGESWTDLRGGLPQDPSITALIVDPSNVRVIYAGSKRGIFRTADGGQTWTSVNTGLPELEITAMAIDPSDDSILYAATWSSGLYKSHDAGQSWKAINAGFFSLQPRSIVIDPSDPRRVYVGCWGSGVYMTTTAGE